MTVDIALTTGDGGRGGLHPLKSLVDTLSSRHHSSSIEVDVVKILRVPLILRLRFLPSYARDPAAGPRVGGEHLRVQRGQVHGDQGVARLAVLDLRCGRTLFSAQVSLDETLL